MAAPTTARYALFGALFFLSGAAGLIYEQLWIRELQQFFGSTIHSITTVVATYMGGLGLGAWVLGRRIDRHRNPAHVYGLLELLIGGFGILSPLIFANVGAAWIALARALEPGLWVATAIKAVVAFIVMLVPTFLMGGTLPVLTRAFAGQRRDRLRHELALFYGLNTVGGVAGCVLAGVVLVEHVGLWQSLVACGLLNFALGGIAIAASREHPEPTMGATGEMAAASAVGMGLDEVAEEAEVAPAAVNLGASDATRKLAIWLIGITAFASLLYEIAWTRTLIMVVGSSTYAFTTILACFLLGIGLGSLIAVGHGKPARALLIKAAIVQGAVALTAALIFPFFRTLPVYIIATLQVPFLTGGELIALHTVPLVLVVVPPALGLGLIFPILAELSARATGQAGTETGRAYAANTLGSILGSIVTGFVLIHLIGSERTLVLGVAITATCAAVMAWHLYRERGETGVPTPGERLPVILAIGAVAIAVLTPAWSSRLLDRGPAIYGRERMSRVELDQFLRGFGQEQLLYDEGWNATISVWRSAVSTWLKTNGKTDASTNADMDTQVMLGLLPGLAHPEPGRAFVIGYGSGVTARTLADVQGIRELHIAEIEEGVLEASRFFESVNRNVLSDPRVRVINDDARSALQLAGEPYDIIVSEPSNPWIAGVASLYTREFFRIVRSRLAPGGILSQWVQTYRVPVSVVAVIVANLRAVFPHVEIWHSNTSDLIILASDRPIVWRHERVAAHFEAGPVAEAMRDWIPASVPADLFGYFVLSDIGTTALAGTAAFSHDDNRPSLEFVAARALLGPTQRGSSVFDSLMSLREAVGDSVPNLAGAWQRRPGDWQAALAVALPPDSRHALQFAEAALGLEDSPRNRGVLGTVYLRRGDFHRAVPHLRTALAGEPGNPQWLLRAGLALANTEQTEVGLALLERVAASGGDSVQAFAALAQAAADGADWERAAAYVMRSLRALRPTIASPFPGTLENALRRIADFAPPPLAVTVLETAVNSLPAWELAYRGAVVANLRWGRQRCGRALELADELPRFGWTNMELANLLRICAAS
ncbi:MAG TPA: fused MFS/spermidine synthase [Gemmatimonadales bacterium]|nr:fused MFS/spermidine synthase [Gemmatimonadales bacterium]